MPVASAPRGGTGAAGSIAGRVDLEAALASKVALSDTVFIFARAAEGPRMPLAVLRIPAKELPRDFSLDDSMSMAPGVKLSATPSVIVEARHLQERQRIAAVRGPVRTQRTAQAGRNRCAHHDRSSGPSSIAGTRGENARTTVLSSFENTFTLSIWSTAHAPDATARPVYAATLCACLRQWLPRTSRIPVRRHLSTTCAHRSRPVDPRRRMLLLRRRSPTGRPKFELWCGVAAVDVGRPGEGVLALERYVLQFPDDVRAQLELARAYFYARDDLRARQEFEAVAWERPPADVQGRHRPLSGRAVGARGALPRTQAGLRRSGRWL